MKTAIDKFDFDIVGNNLYITSLDNKEILGGMHFPIDGNGTLQDPCACDECRAGQAGELNRKDWGQGHFLCHVCPPELLWAEGEGLVRGEFISGRWTWLIEPSILIAISEN